MATIITIDPHLLLYIFELIDDLSKVALLKTCCFLNQFKFNIRFHQIYTINKIYSLSFKESFRHIQINNQDQPGLLKEFDTCC